MQTSRMTQDYDTNLSPKSDLAEFVGDTMFSPCEGNLALSPPREHSHSILGNNRIPPTSRL